MKKIDLTSQTSVFKFNVKQAPLHTDPPGAQDFYKALGIALVAWGRLEGHFTFTLINLMRIAGAGAVSHVLPISWKARIEMWRLAVRAITELTAIADLANDIASRIIDLAQDRHIMIHAMWDDFYPDEPIRIDLVIVKHRRKSLDGLEFAHHTMKLESVAEFVRATNACNTDLFAISAAVAATFPAHLGAHEL